MHDEPATGDGMVADGTVGRGTKSSSASTTSEGWVGAGVVQTPLPSTMDQLESPFTINSMVLIDPEQVTHDRAWRPGSKWLVRPGAVNVFMASMPQWQSALRLIEGTA